MSDTTSGAKYNAGVVERWTKSMGGTFPDTRIKICDMVVNDSGNKLTGSTLSWRCGDADPYAFISRAESDQIVPQPSYLGHNGDSVCEDASANKTHSIQFRVDVHRHTIWIDTSLSQWIN
jgi:hypothetical protein